MYGYEWTGQNGIYRLSVNSKIEKEIRPVFKEELDYFGFNEHWTYPDTDAPLLWAEGIRRYVLNGSCVAEAVVAFTRSPQSNTIVKVSSWNPLMSMPFGTRMSA